MLATDIAAVAKIFTDHRRFLLMPHDRPDGDACGSMLALAAGLAQAGKQVHTVLSTPPGPRYAFLFDDSSTPMLGRDITIQTLPEVDVAVVIDTSATRQLSALADWLKQFSGVVVAIDHHERGDLHCDAALFDESAPAAGLLVCQLLDHLGWLAGPKMAGHLLMAIGTDTGWFSYSNTTPECFEWAAKLARMGPSIHDVHAKLFLAEPPERFRLVGRVLNSAELFVDGQVVAFTLRRDDFRQTGASEAHTENLIDQASRLKTMKVAALFVEASDATVRISLRSREPFDVHAFAQQLGGGGHRHAAGAKITGEFDEVRSRVLGRLIEMMNDEARMSNQ